MILQPRDILVVIFICRYYVCSREMVRQALLPDTDREGRAVRKLLDRLVQAGLVKRCAMLVVNPADGAPCRAFYPTRRGAELAAAETGDESFLLTCTETPQWTVLHHWLGCTQFHVMLDRAASLCPDVKIHRFLHEWAVANPEATKSEPAKRFKLYTLLRETPRLICKPDGAWLLEYKDRRRVYYFEFDRETSGAQQIAASKCPGYAELAVQQGHKRHYPETTDDSFSILHVSLNPGRRDSLRRAVMPKDGSHLWRFAAWSEITPETLLRGEIIYDCDSGPRALVKRAENPSGGHPEPVREASAGVPAGV